MRNASAFISSTSKRASFRATQAPRLPHHTILLYQQLKTKIKYVPLPEPPANMANPWFGSDVAARLYLATLRAAVVQVKNAADEEGQASVYVTGAVNKEPKERKFGLVSFARHSQAER